MGLLWRKEKSKERAKERLQVILIQDRCNLSPAQLEQIKEDIYRVISRYVEINQDEMEMDLKKCKRSMALVANIPIDRK